MTPAQIEFLQAPRTRPGAPIWLTAKSSSTITETEDVDHSIVVIENGHVSGRKLG